MQIDNLTKKYLAIRKQTKNLCQPLTIEDYVIQSMEDVSPPKWHLAHTTWFFETFILIPNMPSYRVFNPLFQYLFNSYYQTLGSPYPRVKRGTLARPTVECIYEYRDYIDQQLTQFLQQASDNELQTIIPLLILGLQHEQQHQELLLMDIKYNFYMDAHKPVYQEINEKINKKLSEQAWLTLAGGTIEIGYQGNEFCFDNELARHTVILPPYQLSTSLVTNGEYAEFIAEQGYQRPEFWLADGWDYIQKQQWQAPLYWEKIHDEWYLFTLNGLQKLNLHEPVSHVSYYEADAFARFHDARLPTEIEWEHYAVKQAANSGLFLESHVFHPQVLEAAQQLFGHVWQWTASAYAPYPGFKPLKGALGEYNGKFMSNQMVLRGGSCVTPQSHFRYSYRNFFQPEKRWMFSGIRLAKSV